ncbi:hypothetical protein NHQ30_005045 [Ciborinia camelliae]|nr:hypothetical protein NHQ30_005045 [Ciborinia camelliae]
MPPSQSADNKLKILIAALSQSASSEKDFLPNPNYHKLAEDLGLPSYAAAAGVWKRLRDELKKGDFGDLRIRDSAADSKSPGKKRPAAEESKAQSGSPGKKRAAEESKSTENDSGSPTKRSKPSSSKRGQSKEADKAGKKKVDEEASGELIKPEVDWMEDKQIDALNNWYENAEY